MLMNDGTAVHGGIFTSNALFRSNFFLHGNITHNLAGLYILQVDNCICVDVMVISGTYKLYMIHELLRDYVHKIHMLCYKLVII